MVKRSDLGSVSSSTFILIGIASYRIFRLGDSRLIIFHILVKNCRPCSYFQVVRLEVVYFRVYTYKCDLKSLSVGRLVLSYSIDTGLVCISLKRVFFWDLISWILSCLYLVFQMPFGSVHVKIFFF